MRLLSASATGRRRRALTFFSTRDDQPHGAWLRRLNPKPGQLYPRLVRSEMTDASRLLPARCDVDRFRRAILQHAVGDQPYRVIDRSYAGNQFAPRGRGVTNPHIANAPHSDRRRTVLEPLDFERRRLGWRHPPAKCRSRHASSTVVSSCAGLAIMPSAAPRSL